MRAEPRHSSTNESGPLCSGIIGSVNIDSVVPYILSMEIPGQYSHDSHTLHEEEGETEDSETENQSQSSQFSVDKYQE